MITFADGDPAVRISLPSLPNMTSVALAILVISVGGAAAALLYVGIRHVGRILFGFRASSRKTLSARMTNRVPATDHRHAPTTSEPAVEFAFDECPSAQRPAPSVAGELWVKEYVGRLRSILPGSRIESLSPSPPPGDDLVELDGSVSCGVAEDDIGVLCASSVVAAGPSSMHVHATVAKRAVHETSPVRAKTSIPGSAQGLPGWAERGGAARSDAAGSLDAGGFDYGGRRG
jgi:hypothetical protein